MMLLKMLVVAGVEGVVVEI